jgi:crossover junction endodeoxyribonuclease RuvC
VGRLIVGIDPGLSGGLAMLDGGVFSACGAMPVDRVGRRGSKEQVAAAALRRLLMGWGLGGPQAHTDYEVVIEEVHAMPGQGVTSMFSFGRGMGRVEGVLGCFGVPLIYVTPGRWKKHFGLDADKKNALALARRLYPTAPLTLEKSVGVAEALLIARWRMETAV